MKNRRPSALNRFLAKVRKTDSCWLWTGNLKSTGYAGLTVKGVPTYAHRFSYELVNGLIPSGLFIDHLCRVKHCVNPSHLEAVTPRTNVRRGLAGNANLDKTHCPQGHEYSQSNTYICFRTDGDGISFRRCRICALDSSKRRYAAALLVLPRKPTTSLSREGAC